MSKRKADGEIDKKDVKEPAQKKKAEEDDNDNNDKARGELANCILRRSLKPVIVNALAQSKDVNSIEEILTEAKEKIKNLDTDVFCVALGKRGSFGSDGWFLWWHRTAKTRDLENWIVFQERQGKGALFEPFTPIVCEFGKHSEIPFMNLHGHQAAMNGSLVKYKIIEPRSRFEVALHLASFDSREELDPKKDADVRDLYVRKLFDARV